MNEKVKPCPCCGSPAHIEDKKIQGKNIMYGRIVCDRNQKYLKPSERCYMKTVCGPLAETIRSWNTRTDPEDVAMLMKEYKDCDHENTVLLFEKIKLKAELSEAVELFETTLEGIGYYVIAQKLPPGYGKIIPVNQIEKFLSNHKE